MRVEPSGWTWLKRLKRLLTNRNVRFEKPELRSSSGQGREKKKVSVNLSGLSKQEQNNRIFHPFAQNKDLLNVYVLSDISNYSD